MLGFSQETEFKSGEDDLKQKDKDLQNKLTAFCQFLQENESKRKKAEERFRQEEKAYAEKEETIKSITCLTPRSLEINRVAQEESKEVPNKGSLSPKIRGFP